MRVYVSISMSIRLYLHSESRLQLGLFVHSYSDDPRLVTLPDKAGIFYMALGLRKNSPLKPIIDEQYVIDDRIMEKG